ncbi:MAG: glycoside hydrolase family 3 C-terminal domain-containing protein [Candidatus Heimdallarchaeota archaeon]|nr:MAG: glycoside hydrolase family 3 C-terminal domain-containing protein [Candidatus Heimdallarchaeota archaeon]
MVDIKSLLSQLTLEEKAAFCTGSGPWQTIDVERLGIPRITMSDGPHGVRKVQNIEEFGLAKSFPATCFPPAVLLASTWNKDLVQRVGEFLGDECISLDVDILLGPGVNIKRTPLCGRNFEYYSEDPYLAGEMGTAFVKGVQSKGVGTSLKHYSANNQEYQRFIISAEIDERTLREIYLPAFEKTVKESQPWTVMCAYNKINGIFASEHYDLLTRIMKSEWNLDGFIVSDWGAVQNRVAALKGGLDLQMPGPNDLDVQKVVEAVKNNELDENVLNQAVERILKIIFRAKKTKKAHIEFDKEKHHEFARKVAAEGIILLKNEDNVLPIKDASSIAIIGKMAKEPRFQGGGSSLINPTKVDNPFQEIKKLGGESILVRYADGYAKEGIDKTLIDEACDVAKQSDIVIIFSGLPFEHESEGYDRKTIKMPESHIELIKAVAKSNTKTIVVLNNGSVISLYEWIDSVPVVIEAYLGGQAGGGAVADVLFGKENPSGKLAESFPKRLEHTPSYINYPGEAGKVRYGEGLYVGYRYYDKKSIEPIFPFGYGLSYTTFAYSNLTISSKSFKDIDGVDVNVDITNTGKVPGKEVVQLYIHQPNPKADKPNKEMKGFSKVELQPNETKTVAFHLDSRSFAYYSVIHKSWVWDNGEYEILVGASSKDIRLRTKVILESTQNLPCKLNMDSTLRDWLDDPNGKFIIDEMIAQRINQVKMQNPDMEVDENQVKQELLMWAIDMPLLRMFKYVENQLPMSAEDLVKYFLTRVGVNNEENAS